MSTSGFPAPNGSAPEFHELMRDQVRDVLFVSSLYDSFILAEDELGDVVRAKFLDLNQLQVPTLHQVATGGEALELLRAGRHFDLVLTALNAGDMNALELALAVRAEAPELPVVLLAYDYGALKEVLGGAAEADRSAIHRSFLWQGDARILLAIVKGVEDEWNVARDAPAGVPILLVVEDNIRNYSSFLPVIYDEVERHSQQVTSEGLNLAERVLRLRARPKILLATSFEQAQAWFEAFPDDVLGVISDVEFPRAGQACPSAGIDFARLIREARPDVTVALHSSHSENERVAASIGAVFLPKRSSHLLQRLREQLKDAFAFGDFVFRTQNGAEIARATDIDALVRLIGEVPGESLAFHGARNDFSRWLRVRAEFHLARGLRRRRISDFADLEQLRRELVGSIERTRRERARGTVADFHARAFRAHGGVTRIGGGSLGGKARGLAFAARMLDRFGIAERFPRVRVFVPPAVVLGTEVFDEFLDGNGLREAALDLDDDVARAALFRHATLPERVRRELEPFLELVREPLAVRSSSLLEDSPYEPFAGIFDTIMVRNAAPDPAQRLARLEAAIKDVYASAFARGARRLLEATPYRMEEARMAVVLQPVIGARHGGRFYPSFAGVARSHNFYPLAPATAQDGVAAVALGLGRMVVEDGPCMRFSPAFPRHLPELSDPIEAMRNTQREFWAIDLEAEDDGSGADALRRFPLELAEGDGTLAAVASTYSRENQALYDGVGREGARLVTFAPVLKHNVFPLAEILRELLQLGQRSTNSPVELEFAVNLEPPAGEPPQFALLQLRPLAALRELEAVDTGRFAERELICRSATVLGNGRVEDVRDVVVVDPDSFNPYLNPQTARHIARFNAQLAAERRPYLLVGVGRWGSSHPQMGIPVHWADISGARAIVEAGRADLHVTPSQGSHFFHNLSASGTGYFVVNPERGEGTLDWDWLAAQPEQAMLGAVRHIRFPRPLTIVMNGRKREGVIRKP